MIRALASVFVGIATVIFGFVAPQRWPDLTSDQIEMLMWVGGVLIALGIGLGLYDKLRARRAVNNVRHDTVTDGTGSSADGVVARADTGGRIRMTRPRTWGYGTIAEAQHGGSVEINDGEHHRTDQTTG